MASLIVIKALRALALTSRSAEPSAVVALDEALAHARPEGYIRVFADEGAPMEALLNHYVALRRTQETAPIDGSLNFANRIMDAFAGAGRNGLSAKVGVGGVVVPLTEREVEVLELVAAGKPNREIAGELYIGVDTVKKHITHILDKLGAANRTEAAARARQFGLLP